SDGDALGIDDLADRITPRVAGSNPCARRGHPCTGAAGEYDNGKAAVSVARSAQAFEWTLERRLVAGALHSVVARSRGNPHSGRFDRIRARRFVRVMLALRVGETGGHGVQAEDTK